MNFIEEMKQNFGESGTTSTKIYGLCLKLEEAERKLTATFTEEQTKLFNAFMNLYCDKSAIETDEAIDYGFNYAKNMFQALIGIKKDN